MDGEDTDFTIPIGDAFGTTPPDAFALLDIATPKDAHLPLSKKDKDWVLSASRGATEAPPPSLAAKRELEKKAVSHRAQMTTSGLRVPETQKEWQGFVMEKYYDLANDLDPKVSKGALDSLARTSVVGLIVDKKEISISTKSTEDLEAELRTAMNKYLGVPIDSTAERVA